MRALLARLARCVPVLGLLAACAACSGGPAGGGSVTIMVPWSGAEFQAFYSVVKRFEARTGIQVNVEVTRATTQQLDAALAAGLPPDLAVLPSVGAVELYADRKATDGRLRPLDIDPGRFVAPFSGLMTVDRQVFAVPVKADVKSLIWYDPEVTRDPPTTLAAQRAFSPPAGAPWCLGLASGPTSGWPGADWIADILLAGPDGVGTYEKWVAGTQKWDSAPVEAAWRTWGGLVRDSAARAPVTEFSAAAKGMTQQHPSCALDHGALSAMGFGADLVQEKDYDFAGSPGRAPLEVSGDFVGMFAAHNPRATELIEYLSGQDAQTAWVGQTAGHAFSASREVPISAYPKGIEARIAAMLRPESGHTLCFSAADLMPPDLSAAFYRAVLNYTANRGDPSGLLRQLDKVRGDLDQPQAPNGPACSTPPRALADVPPADAP
ncbi:carbohydrate ABC transporter substrate-binding protein, CUT1 family [Streptomyces sp. DvalAA-14]|uniref:ABC transporter substrate-binding protein n=1 Tax=unclassified Streptomyces TaxID=2593676 RepID=UPI00081BA019|nr:MULTISPECIES: ABC transporter substrate-binding protein [unclassified Streptomyces]SCD46104.1 carbohydrate ABC transporter substrate-binding protein, CUT1 family [Streptomyces sp. DvalAA-14]